MLTILLIVLLIVYIIVWMVLLKRRIKNTYTLEQHLERIHLYSADAFPLNIYYEKETVATKEFATLNNAVQKAIELFNRSLDYRFFAFNENVYLYPHVLLVQIVCGGHRGCSEEFDGEGGILAHATFPPFRRMCIDCADMGFTPLFLVVMHEMGHIIGLPHTEDTYPGKSLMHAYIDESLPGLTPYDIDIIKRLYSFIEK